MRGRMGLGLVLMAVAMLVVACASPDQRAAKKQAEQEKKIAAAEAKKQKEIAAADAKRQKEEAKRQAEEDKRLAAEQRKQEEIARKKAEKERREMAKEEKENADAIGSDLIRDERKVNSVDRFVMKQAAAGAREDAMLDDQHFDGADLNSLGQSKLMLIGTTIKEGSTAPVVVYLNSTDSKLQSARTDAVQAFWKKSPHGDVTLTLKNGLNEDVSAPAQPNIDALHRIRAQENSTTGTETGLNTPSVGSSTPSAAGR